MSFIGSLFKQPEQTGGELQLNFSTNESRRLIIGKAGTAGKFVWHGLSDIDRGDNRELTRVIVLAGHRCNRLTRVWGDGELQVETNFQHGVRRAMSGFREGSSNRLWLTFYDGRPGQPADPWLQSEAVRPVDWPANATLSGCAYAIVTMWHDRDILTSPVDFVFEVEGARLYDRRQDTTAGGSGSQRWDNPATWVYTSNPAVAADHYQLGMVGGQNNDHIIFGMGRQTWQVPYACLLYTSPSPRDQRGSRMPSSA